MPTDDQSFVLIILGPLAVGTLLAALIWYIQSRWPRDGDGRR